MPSSSTQKATSWSRSRFRLQPIDDVELHEVKRCASMWNSAVAWISLRWVPRVQNKKQFILTDFRFRRRVLWEFFLGHKIKFWKLLAVETLESMSSFGPRRGLGFLVVWVFEVDQVLHVWRFIGCFLFWFFIGCVSFASVFLSRFGRGGEGEVCLFCVCVCVFSPRVCVLRYSRVRHFHPSFVAPASMDVSRGRDFF